MCYHRQQMGEPRTPARRPVPAALEAAQDDAEQARRQAEVLGLPFDPLDRLPDDAELWAQAPLELMVRFVCVPTGREGARLVLAFGGLDNLLKVDEAEFHLGRPIEAVVAPYLEEHPGAAVLILGGAGAGSVPLYAAAIAVGLGAERVDFHDTDARRLEIARRLGAHPNPVSSWPKRLGSYPITVEACQDPDGLACALRSTEPGGHCTSASIYFGGTIPCR